MEKTRPTVEELEAILNSEDDRPVIIRPDGSIFVADPVTYNLAWPDPTPEMLAGNPMFDAIWNAIKSWDINVPGAYNGYCGATGNHVRAIYDAIHRSGLQAAQGSL